MAFISPKTFPAGIRCVSFNRWGGVSAAPFNELNVGFNVGDDPAAVAENRYRICDEIGTGRLIDAGQVHGDRLVVVKGPEAENGLEGIDGLMTREPGLALLIQHADCQAVVIYDPIKRAVSNIHCGWRGNVAGILLKAVRAMKRLYGSSPSDLWAYLSPSMGPCCGEFRGWKELLPEEFYPLRTRGEHFDFWAISRRQLGSAGIPFGQIELARICTVCSTDHFSYRREGRTGRCGTVVMLESY
jgi:YfiH family protein